MLKDKADYEGMPCQTTATTGIAATAYNDGRTLHRLYGLGVQDSYSTRQEGHSSSLYGPSSQRAHYLRKLQLLIIDEASMMSRLLLELIDETINDLRHPKTDNEL